MSHSGNGYKPFILEKVYNGLINWQLNLIQLPKRNLLDNFYMLYESNKRVLWLGALALITLTGCSSVSTDSQLSTTPLSMSSDRVSENQLPATASQLLDSNPDSFTVAIDDTQQILTADPSYYSANNRICRTVHFGQSVKQDYIACQQTVGMWTLHKPLP